MISDKFNSNRMMFEVLEYDKPCMIGRLGANELSCMANYLGVKAKNKDRLKYIKGNSQPWWWEKTILTQMMNFAGFFPATETNAEKFCRLMMEDMKELDILGSWLLQEQLFIDELQNTKRVMLEDLEPFFCDHPWTLALKGKKVLVVHPFAETIENQYQKREKLFDNGLLPEFDLKTIKAVQSLGGRNSRYQNWFDALEGMKNQINCTSFDVAIIGCGAYGFPLAAHVKRIGKKAIHLGGVTQVLFGIIGKRWELRYKFWPYMNLFNEHWVRPADSEKPESADQVEGGTYW